MEKYPEITRGRVKATLDKFIRPAIYGPRAPLDIVAHHVRGEPIPLEEALAADYRAFEVGDEWGNLWGTTWFRFRGEVPREWSGSEVVALIDLGFRGTTGFGPEGLVYREGAPVQAITPNHPSLVMAAPAAGGERVEFFLEAAANPTYRTDLVEWPVLLPDPEGPPLFRLTSAELAVFRREVYDFLIDYRVLLELMEALPAEDTRSGEILYTLNEACNALDFEDVPSTVAPASAVLKQPLARPASAGAHRISAAGHAHIDTAWLWPLREAVRKCTRSFSTALSLMERYPEFHFVCSQTQHWDWIRERYPILYERIKAQVRAGRFEPVGGMWVEADCNIASGESLVRQILLGKSFFLDEFGYEVEVAWLPDTFGFPASLPQILARSGLRYFLTQKISWNQFNQFPHHTFWWEGIDGSRVFAHFPPADTYNAAFGVGQVIQSVRNFHEHGRANRSLYIYGYGDGGGGPTADMIETARRIGDLEGVPRVRLEGAADFFRAAEADAETPPVWAGELYLETHRGTYTTQARTKRHNRKLELLLREAEIWHGLAPGGLGSYPAGDLERLWKTLLLHQFHDILPGSSVRWVYEEAESSYEEASRETEGLIDAALGALADRVDTSGANLPVVVFNSCSHPRRELVSLDIGDIEAGTATGEDGTVLPVQRGHDGRLMFPAEVPPMGFALYDLGNERAAASAGVEAEEGRLENEFLRVSFDAEGLIESIWDKRAGREVIQPGARGNLFQVHPDYPNAFDAWDVDLFYRERAIDLREVEVLEIVEHGPLRAALRMVRSVGDSRIEVVVMLAAGSSRLEFHTKVDWQETHKFLKVAFPVEVRSSRATYEIQFGHVERPTHLNTSWDLARFEVCAHKWADLSEPGYGVALLNDCKYGHDIHGNVMRLSLLRAPTLPDPLADRGRHEFSYALMPHPGGPREAGVIQQGYNFNIPLRAVAAESRRGPLPSSSSFFWVEGPGAAIETVKKAERQEALILRLYEARGGRGPVVLRTSLPVASAARCDLMERPIEDLEVEDGGVRLELNPFEIVTILLELQLPA